MSILHHDQTLLEQLYEVMKTTPTDLQRDLDFVRTADQQCEQLARSIDKLRVKVLYGEADQPRTTRTMKTHLERIRQLELELFNLQKEKLAVIKNLKATMNHYMVRIDDDLSLFRQHLVHQGLSVENEQDEMPMLRRHRRARYMYDESESDSSPSRSPSFSPAIMGGSGGNVPPILPSAKHLMETRELFCKCRQPSYGQMVGCDSKTCKYKWFHFKCVGLKVEPVGKWFCPDCSSKR